MRSIWKATLAIIDNQIIDMPRGAVPLSAQFQRGVLCLWMRVETTEPLACYHVAIIGTGNPAEHLARHAYVGTAQDPERPLVWHVFVCPVGAPSAGRPETP